MLTPYSGMVSKPLTLVVLENIFELISNSESINK